MRIISGIYRGRVLKSPPDLKTRPTSDRLRETLFNILAPRLADTITFLDLCAGTGAVGIEALSRGAKHAVFVDKSRKSCSLIETNLDLLSIPENQTDVVKAEALDFIKRSKDSFDIVFFDPPYEEDYLEVLVCFAESGSNLLGENGLLIAEHRTKEFMPEQIGELRRWRIVKQGESSLSFYERK